MMGEVGLGLYGDGVISLAILGGVGHVIALRALPIVVAHVGDFVNGLSSAANRALAEPEDNVKSIATSLLIKSPTLNSDWPLTVALAADWLSDCLVAVALAVDLADFLEVEGLGLALGLLLRCLLAVLLASVTSECSGWSADTLSTVGSQCSGIVGCLLRAASLC